MLPAPTFLAAQRAGPAARRWPAFLFSILALVSAVAVLELRRLENDLARVDFERVSQHLLLEVGERLGAYEQLARGTAGLIESGVRLGPEEFAAYLRRQPLALAEAGFLGIGVAQRRPDGERFALHWRAWPQASAVPAVRDDVFAGGRGIADAGSAVADALRDGRTAIAFVPLFRANAAAATAATAVAPEALDLLLLTPLQGAGARQPAPADAVAIGLRVDALISSVLASEAHVAGTHAIRLRVIAGTAADARLLFDSAPDSSPNAASSAASNATPAKAMFSASYPLSAGTAPWRLELESLPTFEAAVDRRDSRRAAMLGAVVTVLLSGLAAWRVIRRRRAEVAAVLAHRDYLQRMLDTLDEPVVVKSADLRVVLVNQVYADMIGCPAETIVGRLSHDFLPSGAADASMALDQPVLDDGQPRQAELLIPDHRRQGALRNIIVRKTRGRGLYGEPLVVGIHQDVTELREYEARFRHLTQLSSDWYWEQDAELRYSMLVGKSDKGDFLPDDVIGKHRWDFPIEWSEAEWAEHKAMLAAHLPFRDLEYRVRDDALGLHWFSISGEPIFDADGDFTGYRGIGRNVTARRQVEEELRRHRDHLAELVKERTADLEAAKDAAEQASHVKSEFLANMSHELRTPLHAILSFARLGQGRIGESAGAVAVRDGAGAVDGGDLGKARRYFARILDAGERLLGLVTDLLDLSKMEAGKMRYELRPCDLVQLIHGAAFEFEALAEERQLRFELPPPEMPAPAMVDAPRFAQVLRNVFSNAFKFSHAGGWIRVSVAEVETTVGRRASDLAKPSPAWRITICDDGVGIPEDEVETVFEKFIQSSKTRTGAGGTGLGLAICREIVAAHRGSIAARNRPEGGTSFEILVPR